MGRIKVIIYEWTCACQITIKADSEKQIAKAKQRHYLIHAKEAGWDKQ